MKALVAVIVLTALALIGSRRGFVPGKSPIAVQAFFTGAEFIVIGLLLGREFLNVIDEATLDLLRPFVCVILGWVGFLFGLQFDRRTVSNLPTGYLTVSAVEGVITLAAVLPVAWYLLTRTTSSTSDVIAVAAVALAASAACTGLTALRFVEEHGRPRSLQMMSLLRFVPSIDPIVGVIAAGAGLSLFAVHPFDAAGFPIDLQWFVISICLGLVTAWVFVSLTLTRTSEAELTVYLLGVIALAGGVAFAFHLSALFVSFVCGLAVANLTHVRSIRGRVMTIMAHGDRFLYIVLLVLAGAYLKLPDIQLVSAALVFVAVRLVGKVVGGYLSTRQVARHHPVPPLIGFGLISQGGMGLAIIVELRFAVDQPLIEAVVSVAILAIIINEILAPWLAIRTAARAGESVS
jgi:hypothetical protein